VATGRPNETRQLQHTSCQVNSGPSSQKYPSHMGPEV
jgi:hypothetical protein